MLLNNPQSTSVNLKADRQTLRQTVSLLSVFAHLVALNQQSFQSGDFSPQFPDQPDVAVLVDGGFVDDVLGSVSVSQSAERLTIVHISGGNGCGEKRF